MSLVLQLEEPVPFVSPNARRLYYPALRLLTSPAALVGPNGLALRVIAMPSSFCEFGARPGLLLGGGRETPAGGVKTGIAPGGLVAALFGPRGITGEPFCGWR